MKKKRNSQLYLTDILDAINKIYDYTAGLTFERFCANTMAIDAVIRNFEIIGEASKNIPLDIKASNKMIPWKEMAGMRNKMIHEYFGVDLDIVWKTIQHRLSELETLLKKI